MRSEVKGETGGLVPIMAAGARRAGTRSSARDRSEIRNPKVLADGQQIRKKFELLEITKTKTRHIGHCILRPDTTRIIPDKAYMSSLQGKRLCPFKHALGP